MGGYPKGSRVNQHKIKNKGNYFTSSNNPRRRKRSPSPSPERRNTDTDNDTSPLGRSRTKKYTVNTVIPDNPATESTSDSSTLRNYDRLPRSIYDLGIQDYEATPCILRPSKDHEFSELDQTRNEFTDTEKTYISSNRIINMSELSNVISFVYEDHLKSSKRCRAPTFQFPQEFEVRQGLASYMVITCTSCNYHSPKMRYFEAGPSKPGRPRAMINLRSGHFLLNSNISQEDYRLMCICHNIPPPSQKTLQANVTYASDIALEEGEKTLKENRKKLVQLLEHQDSGAIIALDASYNNPPKGRSMSLPATQSSIPIHEYTTNKQMMVDMQVFSQVCNTGKTMCSHTNCKSVNYPQGKAMSDVEKLGARSTSATMAKSNIKVTKVVCDGCKQILPGVEGENIEKLMCTIHVSRNQDKLFFRTVGWSSGFLAGHISIESKKIISRQVRGRCSAELTRCRRKHKSDTKFYRAVSRARKNIIPCFSGDHSKCSYASQVCRPSNRPNFGGKNKLDMTREDMDKLQRVVDYKLSAPQVKRQRYLFTTNKVEAQHLRSFKLCPKHKLYKRTYRGRMHNVVLLDTLGLPDAILVTTKAIGCGVSPEVATELAKMKSLAAWRRRYRQSKVQKQRRHNLKEYKLKAKRFSKMKLNTETAHNVHMDHMDYTYNY